MTEVLEAAADFARRLIRGKDPVWTKRARGVAAAVYRVAQDEGKKGEDCEARAIELLCAPAEVLLDRMRRSVAVSVSMQVKLLTQSSAQQRALLLDILSVVALKRFQPHGNPRND